MQETRRGPLGAPTITPTLGGGGHGPNIVPQDAYVHVDYRVSRSRRCVPLLSHRLISEGLHGVLPAW